MLRRVVKMKILALHLPAFHRIKENDEWWGKGFTEWDNVKRGKPLYKGHIQPLTPLNGDYYDLSQNGAIEKQANTAKQYGVDGFIFYHYWFKGHKLLEKPVEGFRDESNIEGFQYCLCWANETWARTWDGRNSDILIKQEYGDKSDWLEHIKYLVTFFKDKKYLYIEDRPVLYIYSTNQIPNVDAMINVWNNYLKSIGIKPIYLVEFMRAKNNFPSSKYSEGVIEFEPMYTIRYDVSILEKAKRYMCKKLNFIDYQNYDSVWAKMLRRVRTYDNKKIFKSCFVAWDNSPRKGRKNSIILKNCSPKSFGRYFLKLLNNKRPNSSNEMVVINAWNEWGEGAILEPSDQFQYQYLEEIRKSKNKYENIERL